MCMRRHIIYSRPIYGFFCGPVASSLQVRRDMATGTQPIWVYYVFQEPSVGPVTLIKLLAKLTFYQRGLYAGVALAKVW